MAELALLLKLRVRLWWRRFRVGGALALALSIGGILLVAIATITTLGLIQLHDSLDAGASRRLGQIETLTFSTFLIVGPLVGFRAQEFMDVTKLFTLPVRPSSVFLSTTLGSFLGVLNLVALPILIVPPAMRSPGRTTTIVLATLIYLALLYALLQCVTLAFLSVLRSRRFRDLTAILAPAIGLAVYAALQAMVFVPLDARAHAAFLEFLDSEQLAVIDVLTPYLPPLWYADVAYGEASLALPAMLMAALFAGLVIAGTKLTLRAFHGEVAPTRAEEDVSRAPASRHLARVLSAPLATQYEKERQIQRRDPWTRMLLIQQLGFVALVTVGEALFGSRVTLSEGFPIWLLLYFEAGFLQNQLGLEGSSFAQTAMSPLDGRRILLGKNLAWLRSFGVANLLMIPSLFALAAWLGDEAIDTDSMIAHTTVGLVTLPAIFGSSNLVSVYLPLRVPQRSRRALGQDQSQGGGCATMIVRTISALVALAPAIACALLVLRIGRDAPPGAGGFAAWLGFDVALATLASLATYALCTAHAGRALDARRRDLAQYLR